MEIRECYWWKSDGVCGGNQSVRGGNQRVLVVEMRGY